jgi:hypothetical protein
MSISNCLKNAVDGGEISADEAERLNSLYEGFRAQHKSSGAPDADQRAKADTVERLTAVAQERKRRVLLAAVAHKRILQNVETHLGADGKPSIGGAAIAHLIHRGGAKFTSVQGVQDSIISEVMTLMKDLNTEFQRTRISGKTPKQAEQLDLLKEAFGEDSGSDVAKAFADAWGKASELTRQRFNRAGGSIGKLDKWGAPQHHRQDSLIKAGEAEWKRFISPMLDWAQMPHAHTGKPILPSERDAVLSDVYQSIVTDGANKQTATRQTAGAGALAGQRGEHRFLKFKGATEWMAYAEEFGEPNLFGVMWEHLRFMARDIAFLEVLGPNPSAEIEFFKQAIRIDGKLKKAKGKSMTAANTQIWHLENLYSEMRGHANVAVNEWLATTGSNIRNVITSAKMTSAVLMAVPGDVFRQVAPRRLAGLPMLGHLKSLATSIGKENRDFAAQLGFISDVAMAGFETRSRYDGALEGTGWTRKWADRAIAWGGLSAWTEFAKRSWYLGILGDLAQASAKKWDELDPDFRWAFFENYGIGPDDWDVIRKSQMLKPRSGVAFVDPTGVRATDQAVGDKFSGMLYAEMKRFIVEGDAQTQALLRAGTKRGTLVGETAASFRMFKSVAVMNLLLDIPRTMQVRQRKGNLVAAEYVSMVVITSAMAGYLAGWLKDIRDGKDPRPILNEDGSAVTSFGAAVLTGGGLGIFGDFLFGNLNRFGSGFGETLGGPVASEATGLANLLIGNIAQGVEGDKTNFAEEARSFVDRNTPFKMWYLRLAYQRIFMDQLEKLTDPDANRKFKQKQRRLLKEQGNGYWWRPGQVSPDRAPAFGGGR